MAFRNWLPAETRGEVTLGEATQAVGLDETSPEVPLDETSQKVPLAEDSREGAPGETGREDAPGETAERCVAFRRGAKALVTAPGSALLVRERHADGSPFWTLPGGGVHSGESTVTAVERELAEELRCRAVVAPPVTAFPYAHTSSPGRVSVYTVHECRLLSEPTPVATEGVYDLQWVSPGSIPTRTLPQVRTVVERALDP